MNGVSRSVISVDRTADMDLISWIISQEGIREFIWDDSGPAELPVHPNIYYLLASLEAWDEGALNNVPIGLVVFMPINSIVWNPHIAILRKYRGTGTEVMMAGIEWIFANTECKKLVANPPEYNVPMIRVFEKCEFSREGYSPKSVLKGGLLHGRVMMGRAK